MRLTMLGRLKLGSHLLQIGICESISVVNYNRRRQFNDFDSDKSVTVSWSFSLHDKTVSKAVRVAPEESWKIWIPFEDDHDDASSGFYVKNIITQV